MRTRKLIQPSLQLRLVAKFVAVVLLALVFQYVLFASVMSGIAVDLAERDQVLFQSVSDGLTQALLLSLGVVLPLAVAVGVLSTFRIAGPIYRIQCFLRETLEGKSPASLRLRKGDELQDLARLLVELTSRSSGDAVPGEQEPERPAA